MVNIGEIPKKYIDQDYMAAIATILLFNWVTLKEIEGIKVTTDKNLATLRILTLVIASVTLVNCFYLLMRHFNGKLEITGLTILILLRIVFVATISFHAMICQNTGVGSL